MLTTSKLDAVVARIMRCDPMLSDDDTRLTMRQVASHVSFANLSTVTWSHVQEVLVVINIIDDVDAIAFMACLYVYCDQFASECRRIVDLDPVRLREQITSAKKCLEGNLWRRYSLPIRENFVTRIALLDRDLADLLSATL